MLNALRRGAKSIFAKILIAILVMSFAVWGVSGFVNQIDPTEVARAGHTPVSANEFARLYQRTITNTSQQMGRAVTPQEAQAIGIPTQVLSQLVTEAFQVDAAHALGVDLGDDALAERIREEQAFAGADGSFDRFRFDQILASNQYTEAEFIELQREAAAQEMLVNGLFGGMEAPRAYLEAFNRFRNQTRRVTYITLTEDGIGPIEDPTDVALQSYYDENKSQFRAPEYRALSTVTLSAEALADPAAVSADAVERAYNVPGAYGSPEQRQVEQVVLGDQAAAQKAAEEINAGSDYATVVSELGRSSADLGLVSRDRLVDSAVADAAFSMEAGQAAAVDGRFGPVLVHVSQIVPAGKRPLEEVEAEIRDEIARDEAAGQVRTLYDSVEDAVAGGARVEEIAERFSLPTRKVEAVAANGETPSGGSLDPSLDPRIISTAFAIAEGDDPEPVEIGDSYLWVQLDGITETADRPFDEVSTEVLVAWTEAQKAGRLGDMADKALKAVEDGTPFEEVATQYNTSAIVTEPFSQGAPPQDLAQPAPAAAFEGPMGHTASVIAEDGSHIIMKVTEVSEPAFFEGDADLQSARGSLNDGLVDTMLYELVNARQAEMGATVNQPVLNQIIGIGEGLHQR